MCSFLLNTCSTSIILFQQIFITFHRYIATTHFEPTDARAAFPCFDEPELKAKFQLTMVRDKTHLSLFNMPLVKSMEYPEDSNLVQDVFQESVKMSTYLVAFVVCDYASLKNTTKRGTKVHVDLILFP